MEIVQRAMDRLEGADLEEMGKRQLQRLVKKAGADDPAPPGCWRSSGRHRRRLRRLSVPGGSELCLAYFSTGQPSLWLLRSHVHGRRGQWAALTWTLESEMLSAMNT